jgi:ring-1,2-phenylacetyl-CoA epoxidase subunit PaaC
MNYSENEILAIKEFLYKIADDQLIIGHRNSEWTGLGPVLEEDIAFSSIAQDKLGQSYHIYSILHELGEADPDTIAFTRDEKDYKCCHLVEYPIGEYDFSLIRNFLFSHSELLRFEMLAGSSFEPIAKLAKKIKGEIKYHVMHSDVWISKLGRANEESNSRLQTALNNAYRLALGLFEQGIYEEQLIAMNVFSGELELHKNWEVNIRKVLDIAGLSVPENNEPVYGGRKENHSEYLKPLLNEMTEVFRLDPKTEW